MTTVTGGAAHSKRIAGLIAQAKDMSTELYVAADMIRTEAVLSITAGSVSGENHVPSAPGEPPNADTNQLDNSIHVRKIDNNHFEVVADAPHATPQEYGTADGRLSERPYMRPAAAKEGPRAGELITAAVNRRTKGS